MVEKKDNPSNVELLKIAKDLVYSEYAAKKNDIHEKWVVESLYLWQTQHVRMAYPDLPPYPTDEDIINRAKSFIEYLNTPRPDLGEKITNDVSPSVVIHNNNNNSIKEQSKDGFFSKMVQLMAIVWR